MINELIKIDKTFNEAMFKTKVDNIFIMLHSSIMTDNLDRVLHFLSDELKIKFQKKLDELNSKNYRQMYDELNVESTTIEHINITDDKIIIKVKIIGNYMDYIVDKTTLKYISGINTRRIKKINYLTFEKLRNTKRIESVRKCPGCGVSISVNTNGKCIYCGTIFNQKDYDFILTNITIQ